VPCSLQSPHFKGSAICPLKGVGHRDAHKQKRVPAGFIIFGGHLETFLLWSVLFAAHFCIWLCCKSD